MTLALGSRCRSRGSFARSPAAHLLCGPDRYRSMAQGLGTLALGLSTARGLGTLDLEEKGHRLAGRVGPLPWALSWTPGGGQAPRLGPVPRAQGLSSPGFSQDCLSRFGVSISTWFWLRPCRCGELAGLSGDRCGLRRAALAAGTVRSSALALEIHQFYES